MSDTHNEGAGEFGLLKSGFAKALFGRAAKSSLFSDKVLLALITGLTFLLPIFFVPIPQVAPEFAKILLIEAVVLFAIFAWAMGRMRDGHVEIQKSLILGVSLLIVVQFVISALLSPVPSISFLGSGYDVGTVNMIAILFLLLFLSSSMYRTRDRALYLLAAIMLSSGIMLLYHLARYFIGDVSFLDFGMFNGPTTSPVGKWNDFATLAGAATLVSLVSLYFFSGNKMIRRFSYAYFALGFLFLILIDFTVLWLILFVLTGGIIALAIYEGELTHRRRSQTGDEKGEEHLSVKPLSRRLVGHLPVLATILLVVSFIYGSGLSALSLTDDGKSIASVVSGVLGGAPYSELVPTSKVTADVVSGALKESALFGAGPNRFASAYLQNKPSTINVTPFWDTAFDSGIGRIPTFFATTGLIGILLWLAFIVLLFWKGRKIYALLARDRVASFIGFMFFMLAVYFWGIAFFYVPNVTIFAYAFIVTGALVAFLSAEGMIATYRVEFGGDRKLSLVLTPLIVMIMVGAISAGVLVWRQTASLVYFSDARIALSNDDIGAAEMAVGKAILMSDRAPYWRFVASLNLMKLQNLAQNTTLSQADRVAAANQYVASARGASDRAVLADPTDFENYMASGGVYDALGTFGIGNTFESARAEYTKALALNPHSPRVLFMLGRVAILAGDRAGAEDYLVRALEERPNFTEAISVLSQLYIQDQHPEKSEAILKNAIAVEQGNFVLRFTLGYLRYSIRDYKGAVESLESAVLLNPVYANAKYFLGLSYARLGRTDEAIAQFTDVAGLNPENSDVPRIIRNLRMGRDPLEPNIVPPPPTDVLNSGTVLENTTTP